MTDYTMHVRFEWDRETSDHALPVSKVCAQHIDRSFLLTNTLSLDYLVGIVAKTYFYGIGPMNARNVRPTLTVKASSIKGLSKI